MLPLDRSYGVMDDPCGSALRGGGKADAGKDASNPFGRFYFNGPDKIRTCDLVLIRDAL